MTGCSAKLLFLFILLLVPTLLFGGFRCDDDVTADVISDSAVMLASVTTATPGWCAITASPRLLFISPADFRPQLSSARLGSESARCWLATQCNRSSEIPAAVSVSVSVVSSTNHWTLGIGGVAADVSAAAIVWSSPPLGRLNAISSPTFNAQHFLLSNSLHQVWH